MATSRFPTTANSPLETKGDLFTYSTGSAKLAVGNNGESLVADSSTSTGLRYTAGNPISNPVLNSAYQVWQRGTSVSIPASTTAYSADRWQVLTGANQATTVSRQTTSDSTNLPNIQYCARFQRNSGQTGTTNYFFANSFETINSIPYAGKTVTVSFYARKGANYTAASDGLFVGLNTATGTDENVFNYATGVASPIGSTVTLTSTWQRFSVSATLSSTLNEMAVFFRYTPVGTASTNDYFEVTGVQIDIGSVALPVRTYAGTLQGETSACQRYYWRQGGLSAYQALVPNAPATSTTAVYFLLPSQVTMRTTPSAIEYSTLEVIDGVNAASAVTSVGLSPSIQSNSQLAFYIGVASGLTQYRNYYLRTANSTSGYIALTAEL
jgi:hypothetical protein